MNEKINKYQSRLFNKLFATLSFVRKFNDNSNNLDLEEPITHFYSNATKKFWYAKGENDNKFIYIFGVKNKSFRDITPNDAKLIVDFDKEEQFNNDSLGIFSIQNSEIHILINYNVLKERYPYFNARDFKISTLKPIDNNLTYKIIDLGSLNGNFIENLEKIIELTASLEIIDDTEEENESKISDDEDTSNNPDLCKICLKNKNDIKINSSLKNLKKLKPELCGNCIEKIVVSEFYTKISPYIKSNDTQDLNIVKERFGNDQLFDLGIKFLEKYDIIKYIGVKKLFFSLDQNPYLVRKYLKYSDENNLLMDNIFQVKNKNKKKTKQIDTNKTNLTKKTISEMNLFINALNADKSHEEACKIAKINTKTVENWYNLGEKGENDYIEFYKNYKPFHPKNKERIEKMDLFISSLEKDNDIDNALKKSGLKLNKVKSWYNLGEKGYEDYKDFYLACKIILPDGFPKNENKKIVNNDELMNEFITLTEDGKSNDEAIEQLKIPKFKVKNWVNQGKLGNKKYVNFYNAYMIEIEKENELKKRKKIEKKKKKKENKPVTKNMADEKSSITSKRICKICGRSLNNKTRNDICKRCLRKQYASKILLKLLNSIEPEKPFKKEDLKVLNLQNIQIQDYIWTLKEFNLIIEENNKMHLINKDELEKFIKESGLDIDEIPQEQSTVRLNKICKTCGETLEISKFFTSDFTEDGFEENCKDCKRLISTANYLKEIIELIGYENEFSETDLKPYFKNPMEIQAKIWALMDNDLLKKNFENNTYILTDEKTAEEYLDKYYDEKTQNKVREVQIEKPIDKEPKNYTKKDQMKIVIQSINEGKSRKEAAELANIPLYKITHWYNEGRQGYGKDNVNFYNQLKHLETVNETNKELDNISESKSQEYENKETHRKIFLDNFKNGKTKEESADNADLELSIVREWYLKGKNNEEPYRDFYERYIEIKNNDAKVEIPVLEKTDQFASKVSIDQMNLIIKLLIEGKEEKEAIFEAGISEDTYKYWLNRGKQGFGETYSQFYHYIVQIKNGEYEYPDIEEKEEAIDLNIYAPLSRKHISKFNPKMNNKTGIAWVNKTGNNWTYQRQVNKKTIRLIDADIIKLYKKVIKNNQIWGITDYNKASKILDIPEDLIPKEENEQTESEINEISPEIYAPLPQEYLETFPKQSNQTGIAWVNKIGNQFIYSRKVDGNTIKITDYNIEELHKKVIGQNQIWGIRNYSNAKKFIDIPDDFEIPDEYQEHKEEVITDIYAPLSDEDLSKFNPNMNNKSGIAWVSKVGNNWYYQRQRKGKQIRFSDPDIRKLHEKVIKNKQLWGIIDYNKARNVIETNMIKEPIVSSSNISITYIETSTNKYDIIIKGIIKNNELINVLSSFDSFEDNIKRIITNSINNKKVDLFIELEINNDLLIKFEEKIEEIGWENNN